MNYNYNNLVQFKSLYQSLIYHKMLFQIFFENIKINFLNILKYFSFIFTYKSLKILNTFINKIKSFISMYILKMMIKLKNNYKIS